MTVLALGGAAMGAEPDLCRDLQPKGQAPHPFVGLQVASASLVALEERCAVKTAVSDEIAQCSVKALGCSIGSELARGIETSIKQFRAEPSSRNLLLMLYGGPPLAPACNEAIMQLARAPELPLCGKRLLESVKK